MLPENFKLHFETDAILHQKLEDFDLESDLDLVEIERRMIEIMQENNGIGISANQVGFDRRVIIVKPFGQEPFAMFNPVIEYLTGDEVPAEEGCLSFPGLFVQVKRKTKIRVKYVDTAKKDCIIELSGYDARCVQHEIDHLDGICFTDRVSTLKLVLARKKQRKYNGRTK